MKRIDRIRKHEAFCRCMKQIETAEKNRIYCKHDLGHSLDVARIAYILNMEEQGGLSKEIIYAMALLHDLGRSEEYHKGTAHEEAGAALAEQILLECGFTEIETRQICQAIAAHKYSGRDDGDYGAELLYRADKLSRNCFDCMASKTCYWKEECRNSGILY